MAKEIKINILLIIDGKEQGCDLLLVFVWAFPFKEDQVSKCIPTDKIKMNSNISKSDENSMIQNNVISDGVRFFP